MDRSGKIIVKAASGVEELGNADRPMTTDSLFCLYSCTKALASIAVMQLVEQGKVELDAPVGDVLPEVGNVAFCDGRKPKRAITLRHLLTHTSGFGYTNFHKDLLAWSLQNNVNECAGHIAAFMSPLIAEPGEDWNYGVGIDWAGEYLHRVTGLTLGEYSKKNIFEPLGADDLEYRLLPENEKRLVAMHARGEDGKLSVVNHMPLTYDTSFDSGGAGAIGSIESYLKCVYILMNEGVGANGARILKAETVKVMLQDHLGPIREILGSDPLERTIECVVPGMSYPLVAIPGQRKGWGMSFQIALDPLPTGRKAGSVNWAGLPNVYWQVDPESGISTMLCSQSFPFADPAAIMPWLECETEVYKAVAK
ncbi:BZ3500_MvSof-1268-A1-R1_Chr2-3g05336 [Microbotryum saponariae]|uniref:BZ3500_MvSof-1268-A1-R1_Chr2-3g05336 protein n=1 Tax=Microbotryum saponariae TaxID=289078 RepID=A0A2X0LQ16_9BASI|nr:BZ3500_MvSof-1268-A1-R1_Chr2-3g05336 [Microbotryum saponariae]SDA01223.1 BZ3501_MvSof-1269-A2-R1_Chr2-2g05009 [Microbotryum saponariae]